MKEMKKNIMMEKKKGLPKNTPKLEKDEAQNSEKDDEVSLDDVPDDVLLNEELDDTELDSILTEFNVKPEKKPKVNLSDPKITVSTVNDKPIGTEKLQNASKSPLIKPSASRSPLKLPVGILKDFTLWLQQKSAIYEEIAFLTILRKIPATWGISDEELLIDLLEKLIEEKIVNGKLTATSLKFYPTLN